MKELINARRSEEVAVSGSTTLLMFMLCQALAPTIQQGDEINRLIQALEKALSKCALL
jgi:selenocysteine lyase/cysteine desulfurase